MDFFINEILEDERIKEKVRNSTELHNEAKALANKIIATGEKPELEFGMLPLCTMAFLADNALKVNTEKGIAKEITVATLKDVNIWIENYKTQFGKDGIAAFPWLCNHGLGDLFRLGRLQFRIEKSHKGIPGEYAIETHIAQGEPLIAEDCLESFAMAKEFFKKYFPEYSPECFMCDSWLLNPNLSDILPDDSNIIKFMKMWTPVPFESDNSALAIERIFGFGFDANDIANAPENTSLQRKLKAYLLSGGDMDITLGYRRI